MAKRWYDFSARARSAGAKAGVILLAGLAALGASPSPTPALDPDFLLLPTYDLERVLAEGESRNTTIHVGDEIRFRIPGLGPSLGHTATIETPQGSSPLEDLGWDFTAEPADTDAPEKETWFTLTPIKTGHLTLPTLSIKNAEGKAIGRTNPTALDVQSVFDGKNPLDLVPPVGMRFPPWVIIVASILGVAALVALGMGIRWWILRKRGLNVPPPVLEPPKPEDEIALNALRALEKQALWLQGKYKTHYFRVSEVLKNYVGARYGFDAPESTTHEMMLSLEGMRVSDQIQAVLANLFEHLDLVKFTDHVPSEVDSTKILEEARRIVLTTRRPPPVVVPNLPNGPAGGPNAV